MLDGEIDRQPNDLLRFVLGSAFRVGLATQEQIERIPEYEPSLHRLLDDPHHLVESQSISSLQQYDWLIRAAVLRGDLTERDRDFLAKRLHANWEEMATDDYVVLEDPLRVTQLLDLIERPLDRDEYREAVHELLRSFHSRSGGGFQLAGGFKSYRNIPVGDLAPTSFAVQLMELYGVPAGLDMNWVRSFLRPRMNRFGGDRYVAAVTLNRLNALPGVKPPTWFDYLYYERSLLAALVLVAMCLYATLSGAEPKSGSQGFSSHES